MDADIYKGLSSDTIDFSLSGDNVLVSGDTGKSILVFRAFLIANGDTILTFKDGLQTELSGPLTIYAGGALTFDLSNVPWFQTSSGNDFILNSTNQVQVSGAIYYQQD